MKHKITIETGDTGVKLLLSLVTAAKHFLGDTEEVTVDVGVAGTKRVGEPTVQYRAIGTEEALDAIGKTTVKGIIFAHLLNDGPCTVRQIRDAKSYSDKAVQSAIHHLKHMSLVDAEPVGTRIA